MREIWPHRTDKARGELLVAPGTPRVAHAGMSRRDDPNPTSRAAFALAKIGTGRRSHRQAHTPRAPPNRAVHDHLFDNRGPLQIGGTVESRASCSGSGSSWPLAPSGRF